MMVLFDHRWICLKKYWKSIVTNEDFEKYVFRCQWILTIFVSSFVEIHIVFILIVKSCKADKYFLYTYAKVLQSRFNFANEFVWISYLTKISGNIYKCASFW